LEAARALRYLVGPNPATRRCHFKSLPSARHKLNSFDHAALAYDDRPAFMAVLQAPQSLAAVELETGIRTATRTSQVLNSDWSEFDIDKKVRIIPAIRMKADHANAPDEEGGHHHS
jgi:integrase